MDAVLNSQQLLTKSVELVPINVALAQKKLIGLYFSAHWCPPCRDFTPVFAQVYNDIKEDHSDIEIIFVSLDKDVEKFDEYFAEMPWLAFPWAESRELQLSLSEKFEVKTIPTLIFFNDKGEVIDREGRTLVESNAQDIDTILQGLRK